MNGKNWTRRQVLKGAGVALSLPVLETFLPNGSKARAAAAASKKRYFSVYFSCGTADFWTPTGSGATYTLSPILQPMMPNQAHMTVLGNVGNYSPWNGHIEPSHGHNCASAWTGVAANGPSLNNNGISIDQAIANQIVTANGGTSPTPVPSIQLGLSTLDSSPDGIPGQHSRSISWAAPDRPLYKIVSPQAAFDALMGGGAAATPGATGPDPNAEKRRLLNKSALDYVIASSTDLEKRLSTSDRGKMDQFMTSVRTLEQRVSDPTMPVMVSGCTPIARPTQVYGVGNTPAGYDRGMHATLMIDIIAMAIQCDLTRVVSFMLDDARSDFVYSFTTLRNFTSTGSKATTQPLIGGYHNLQHAGNTNDGFATGGWWNVDRLNDLTTKLAGISDGADGTALDTSIITYLSGMNGGNHDSLNLPIALVGSGGGVIKSGQYIKLNNANLQDVHLTILQSVFGSTAKTWGQPMSKYTSGNIPEILA